MREAWVTLWSGDADMAALTPVRGNAFRETAKRRVDGDSQNFQVDNSGFQGKNHTERPSSGGTAPAGEDTGRPTKIVPQPGGKFCKFAGIGRVQGFEFER
jgi:hypothetical protein